ncbi:MAG: TolC family protein [Bacteroidota bacterium]|nr:TolC family protein [Bacteroidota bacterium]
MSAIAQVESAAQNLANNDTLYKISEGRFNVGKIGENDLLQSELAYLNAQTKYENAKVTEQQSKQTLLAALGLPLTTNISLREPSETSSMRVTPAEALARALNNRSDILNF